MRWECDKLRLFHSIYLEIIMEKKPTRTNKTQQQTQQKNIITKMFTDLFTF